MNIHPMWATVPVSQLKADALDLPPDLIEGLLPSRAVVTFAGEPGIGKSFTALSWAASVASGTPWFGRGVSGAFRVVYVLGEGYARFGRRVTAWEEFHNTTLPEWLEFVDGARGGIDLTNSDHVDAAIQQFSPENSPDYLSAKAAPSLIIFDTFSMLARVESENDNAEVARAIANAQRITQTLGSTVVFMHHVSKEGGQVRGATSFRGNADTVVVAFQDREKRREAKRQGQTLDEFMISTHIEHDGKQRDGQPVLMEDLYIGSSGVLMWADQERRKSDEAMAAIAKAEAADVFNEYMAQKKLQGDSVKSKASTGAVPGQSELPLADEALQDDEEEVTA